MLVHLDNVQFKHKPTGQEIGGIKTRMTDIASIRDVTAAELALALARGQTVQPGVTPKLLPPLSQQSQASKECQPVVWGT